MKAKTHKISSKGKPGIRLEGRICRSRISIREAVADVSKRYFRGCLSNRGDMRSVEALRLDIPNSVL